MKWACNSLSAWNTSIFHQVLFDISEVFASILNQAARQVMSVSSLTLWNQHLLLFVQFLFTVVLIPGHHHLLSVYLRFLVRDWIRSRIAVYVDVVILNASSLLLKGRHINLLETKLVHWLDLLWLSSKRLLLLLFYNHLRWWSLAWIQNLLKTYSCHGCKRRTFTFIDSWSLMQVSLGNYNIDLVCLMWSRFWGLLRKGIWIILKSSMTGWRKWQTWLWMLNGQLLYCHMMWCRINMIWSWCMVWDSPYLLKITASRMKLRCSLRGSKEASVVINFVWNRVCHMRGDAAYSRSIIRISFRVGDVSRSIVSPRCNILLRYHTLWSLMTYIYLSENYFGCGSFSN